MMPAAHDDALHQYIDALLQIDMPAALAESPADIPAAAWQLCRLGRLQVLLPNHAVSTPVAVAELAARPTEWHLAHVDIDGKHCRVAELARCIAPGMIAPAIDTLVPLIDSPWLLAVPGKPAPLPLADDAIEWRAQRNSRPWLAGMSRDGHYMALDVHVLVASFATTSEEAPA